MPREEDRRSGKFVGLDGCGEQARGGAKRSAAPPCPRQDSRQMQGRCGGDPVSKGPMAPAPSPPQQRFRHGPRSDPSPCRSRNEKGGTIPPHPCCQWIGICGVEEAAHRNALCEPPSSGGLFARFIQDGSHDIREQRAASCPRSATGWTPTSRFQGIGVPIPVSRCATPSAPAGQPPA